MVDCKQTTSTLADDAEKEFRRFISNVVKENKAMFRNYDIDSNSLDEFYMQHLKDSIQYRSFTHVLKMVLTLSHGQADVERGFSLNDKLIVENMKEESLIAQRFLKDHMLSNGCKSHDIPITKELMQSVKSSNAAYKAALKQKKDTAKKTERDQKLASIDEEMTQLNRKKSSLEEAIKEYQLEADKYAFDAEKKQNLELLSLSNGLKRAAEKKQTELGAVLEKRKCLEEKKEHI